MELVIPLGPVQPVLCGCSWVGLFSSIALGLRSSMATKSVFEHSTGGLRSPLARKRVFEHCMHGALGIAVDRGDVH